MSFHLEWVDPPARIREARSRAFGDGATEEDFLELGRLEQEARSRFAVTIWDMSLVRQEMASQRMLKKIERPQLPAPEEFGLSPSSLSHCDDCDRPGYERWRVEYERCDDTGPGGIPIYKLGTNDGDRVYPREIRGALSVASDWPTACLSGRLPKDEFLDGLAVALKRVEFPADFDVARLFGMTDNPIALWRAWLLFLRGAADHGGFWVG